MGCTTPFGQETVMPLNRRIATGLALCAIVAASVTLAAPASATATIAPNIGSGILTSLPHPAAAPPGVNNYACQLTSAHPRPVVLIPGTFANMEDDYGALGPILANDGYCAFSLDYGGAPGAFIQSTGPIPASAQQVAAFIDNVGAHYGNVQVDLIGHSQGGLVAEYVTKVLGYAAKIHSVIALSPTTHGTTLDGLAVLAGAIPGANLLVGALCPACRDQETGSAVVNAVGDGPIAQPGVSYTVIETRDEYVVTPAGSAFINEPGVSDEYVQSSCPSDIVDHADLSYDNIAIRLTLDALDPAAASAPDCSQAWPRPAVQQREPTQG
jgi:pimeloyl-ACP methyl ester carboxylesterase